ncbi:thyroid transcription factor 1-associated protein 26 [Anas platyrhynchos]|uniref:thyroid transcription factor 1-associated protein 26 n=1 Tax=Anas platyrhynchos TaxID=8839 RepID=UPI003AF30E71
MALADGSDGLASARRPPAVTRWRRDAGGAAGMAAERSGAGSGSGRGAGARRKRLWRPASLRGLLGSLQEGQGFAFRRKQKIERKYRKLLKKERKINSPQDNQFVDTYPEHLKHLYLAEEERLKKQHKRRDDSVLSEEKLNIAVESVTTEEKFKKKTSNQKAKEEYEKIKAERAKKKEEAEKRRQQREEAQRLYKQKKMEAYKILSKKTKKGQPNLNLQMEFLLQKIQQNT